MRNRPFGGATRRSVRMGTCIGLAMILLGTIVLASLQPVSAPKPLPPDLREDPRAMVALADPGVQALLEGKKFRVVNIQEILDYEKAGYPAGSVVVEIFDYTDNVGLGVVVAPDLRVIDLFYPHAIGITEVEQRIAFAIVTFDRRFRKLVAGQDYLLSAAGISGPTECALERCVAVFVATAPKPHPEPDDFRLRALFTVSLTRDVILAIDRL